MIIPLFPGSTSKPWSVATAFYSGLWAYDGWNTANFVTEEVKDAKRNMPRAIIMSTLLVIGLYLVVNVSYYAVLTQHEVSPHVLIYANAILFSPCISVDSRRERRNRLTMFC